MNIMSKFLSEYNWWYHDSSNIDHLPQGNFNKDSKSYSQLSDKENHKSVSNPSKIIVWNDTDFENEESFLLDQSTSSTLTHKLNLGSYSNIENIRSKNLNRLIIPQLNSIQEGLFRDCSRMMGGGGGDCKKAPPL